MVVLLAILKLVSEIGARSSCFCTFWYRIFTRKQYLQISLQVYHLFTTKTKIKHYPWVSLCKIWNYIIVQYVSLFRPPLQPTTQYHSHVTTTFYRRLEIVLWNSMTNRFPHYSCLTQINQFSWTLLQTTSREEWDFETRRTNTQIYHDKLNAKILMPATVIMIPLYHQFCNSNHLLQDYL